MAKLVAVTACPTGIAHTFMAAEALRRVADLKGHELSVESRGAEGVRTPLDEAVVAQAEAVILATDITVDESRFQGKPLVRTSTAVAIRDTERIIDEAVARATLHRKTAASEASAPSTDASRAGPESPHGATSRRPVSPEPEASRRTGTSSDGAAALPLAPSSTARSADASGGFSLPGTTRRADIPGEGAAPASLAPASTSRGTAPSEGRSGSGAAHRADTAGEGLPPLPRASASRRADTAAPTRTPPSSTPAGTLVAVTACPTGIAHTFMAAEALTRAARARGYAIRVETQGSVGAKNTLTSEEIAQADAVIIGADTHVSTERFAGKRLLQTSVGEALKQADRVVEQALALPPPPG
ncbi:PTS fructose-like transporter subunit IIB, partial [Corallococcus exercitus]|uniref:PTS fructose-like transporter subunit IIB n=1 Tax=Corallococcus exercitus TaxID=2316736 RepID=UPI001C0FE45D